MPALVPELSVSDFPAALAFDLRLGGTVVHDRPEDEFALLRLGDGPQAAEVMLDGEQHRSSHTLLPAMTAPASRSRSTTVASRLGMKPSIVRDPFIIGIPATVMLSLIATALPESGPSALEAISVVTYQAPSGFSPGSGNR